MSRKKSSLKGLGILVVAGLIWVLKANPDLLDSFKSLTDSVVELDSDSLTEVKVTSDEYTILTGCKLVEHRNNDGDSFHIRHADGDHEIRLYFVDTAESRLHQYNADRIADQGEYFGGLTQKETIAMGVEGKKLTLGLLKGKEFTVFTKWEMDPSGKRPHAYVVVKKGDKEHYLHEVLAQSGLVRTKTWGSSLPDGRSYKDQRAKVKALESEAKKAKRGAWGVQK